MGIFRELKRLQSIRQSLNQTLKSHFEESEVGRQVSVPDCHSKNHVVIETKSRQFHPTYDQRPTKRNEEQEEWARQKAWKLCERIIKIMGRCCVAKHTHFFRGCVPPKSIPTQIRKNIFVCTVFPNSSPVPRKSGAYRPNLAGASWPEETLSISLSTEDVRHSQVARGCTRAKNLAWRYPNRCKHIDT